MFEEHIDLDEERLAVVDILIRQKACVAIVYNIRVKTKTFAVNDYVWKVILPMDRRDWTLGKWSPKGEGPFQIIRMFTNNAYEIQELGMNRRILRVNGKYLKKYKHMLQEIQIQTLWKYSLYCLKSQDGIQSGQPTLQGPQQKEKSSKKSRFKILKKGRLIIDLTVQKAFLPSQLLNNGLDLKGIFAMWNPFHNFMVNGILSRKRFDRI